MGRVLVAFLTLIIAGGLGVAILIARRPPAPVIQAASLPKPPPKIVLLVAAHPIRAGSILQAQDMIAAPFAPGAVPAGASRDSIEARSALRGAMVRRSLDKGDPILASQILRPGDRGFLAAVLAPGMRAVSVAVDSVSGTAGLIWPGDHVDLILTQTLDAAAQPAGKRVVGETVLRNVRVIAVDQQLAEGGQQSDLKGGAKGNRIITLEVSEAQAERVAVAMRLGRLAVVVRSALGGPASHDARHATPRPVWAQDVSAALRPGTVAALHAVTIYRGSEKPVRTSF